MNPTKSWLEVMRGPAYESGGPSKMPPAEGGPVDAARAYADAISGRGTNKANAGYGGTADTAKLWQAAVAGSIKDVNEQVQEDIGTAAKSWLDLHRNAKLDAGFKVK